MQIIEKEQLSSCDLFLPAECVDVNVYHWWRISLHHSRILCCLVIVTFSYEVGEMGLHPLWQTLDAGTLRMHTRCKT